MAVSTEEIRRRQEAEGSAQNIAQAIQEVSERAQVLIREEIELAKAEVMEKVTTLAKGAAVGVAAGVFALFAQVIIGAAAAGFLLGGGLAGLAGLFRRR